MPNYVANIISFEDVTAEKFKEIMDTVKTPQLENNALLNPQDDKASAFDFNALIPMPKELNITSGSQGTQGLAVVKAQHGDFDDINRMLSYPWVAEAGISTWEELATYLQKKDPKCLDVGNKYYDNIQAFGCPTWYEWCIRNWGTKWNAMNPSIDEKNQKVNFDTAWSAPEPIIYAFAEKFSGVKFRWIYADEDCGCNTGEYSCDGSSIEENFPENSSSEAYSIYIECWGDSDCIGNDAKSGFFHYDCETCPHKASC